MRLTLAFVVALLFAPTMSASDAPEPEHGLAVTVVRVQDEFIDVSWSPAPAAVVYELYRGPALDDLTLVTQTPTLAFTDLAAPDEDTWYVVVSRVPESTTSFKSGPSGKCLILRGFTGVSVHVASCAPIDWRP